MNTNTLQRTEASLTGICRKVLSVVPLKEPWPAKDIGSELFRVTRSRIDRLVLDGCLHSLVDHDLVTERPRGQYRRCKVYTPAPPMPTAHAANDDAAASTAPPSDPSPSVMRVVSRHDNFLDRFAALAAHLREQATTLTQLADAIEEAALTAQQAVDNEHRKGAQFDQLRRLLSNLE